MGGGRVTEESSDIVGRFWLGVAFWHENEMEDRSRWLRRRTVGGDDTSKDSVHERIRDVAHIFVGFNFKEDLWFELDTALDLILSANL